MAITKGYPSEASKKPFLLDSHLNLDHQEFCSWQNLFRAWQQASRGKRRSANVAAFEYALEDRLLELRSELLEMTWMPAPYTSFYIHEPKRRLISAAPFRDRVVHHALCNLIAPKIERSFTYDSYANRVGFGTHRAVDACQRLARKYSHVLAMDVRQFFPSIDHEILLVWLCKQIENPVLQEMMRRILAGGAEVLSSEYKMVWFAGDSLMDRFRPRGLPIGNLTSQLWANGYLTPFDHFVKRELRCPGYVRYVDDFRLFSDDKRSLWDWKEAIIKRMADFRLTVHPGSQPRRVDEGIPFLGFQIWPNRRRIKPRKAIHAARRLRGLSVKLANGQIPLERFQASLRAWISHASHANTVGLRKSVLRSLNLKVPPSTSHHRVVANSLR